MGAPRLTLLQCSNILCSLWVQEANFRWVLCCSGCCAIPECSNALCMLWVPPVLIAQSRAAGGLEVH